MAAKVDARGLSCPQPALLVRNALQNSVGGEVVVLVDSMTQVDNCTRAAEALGWHVECVERAGEFELTLRK
jgi:tRNA 2-thiouridine synthesizing protein A